MISDKQAQKDFEQDQQQGADKIFQPSPAPNSKLERRLLAIAYAAIGAAMLYGSLIALYGAWTGHVAALGWAEGLLLWHRVGLSIVGLFFGLLAVWLLVLAYVRGTGMKTKSK